MFEYFPCLSFLFPYRLTILLTTRHVYLYLNLLIKNIYNSIYTLLPYLSNSLLTYPNDGVSCLLLLWVTPSHLYLPTKHTNRGYWSRIYIICSYTFLACFSSPSFSFNNFTNGTFCLLISDLTNNEYISLYISEQQYIQLCIYLRQGNCLPSSLFTHNNFGMYCLLPLRGIFQSCYLSRIFIIYIYIYMYIYFFYYNKFDIYFLSLSSFLTAHHLQQRSAVSTVYWGYLPVVLLVKNIYNW